MIDINRLNPTTFCIVVLWLQGSLSTSKIASILGVTDGEVRAATREKDRGGFLPKSRQFMTRGERQECLWRLRLYRMDGGRFDRGDFFTAVPIKHEPEEPVEIPDVSTRAGKRKIRELAHEAQKITHVVQREAAEAELGMAPRGAVGTPFRWLEKEGILSDAHFTPDEHRMSEMERRTHAERIAEIFDVAQLSGIKEISMERVGSASLGMSLPERYVMARSALDSIDTIDKSVVPLLRRILQEDDFVWASLSSKGEREAMFETIRRATDVAGLVVGRLSATQFKNRWGELVIIPKPRNRDEVRDAVRTAKELIREGARN